MKDKRPATTEQQKKQAAKPSFLQVLLSTLGAAFGVQSSKTQERDFKHGNIWVYIAAGIIFTGLFILVVSSIVRHVLQDSGI